jgi:hypothetical protein
VRVGSRREFLAHDPKEDLQLARRDSKIVVGSICCRRERPKEINAIRRCSQVVSSRRWCCRVVEHEALRNVWK